jgi:hypothetical protein
MILSGGMALASLEETKHDILIIIIAGLFILFASSLAAPLSAPVEPIIIP